jgi:hypothetical protein
MNPEYLWLMDGIELATFFVGIPIVALALAYAGWRDKWQIYTSGRSRVLAVASGVISFVLFAVAKWMNSDVRSTEYFFQSACTLGSFLLFGAFIGTGSCELLRIWRWHRQTALKGRP